MAEALVRTMWSCALRNSWHMAPLATRNAERSFLNRVPFLSSQHFFPSRSSIWTIRRTLSSKASRGASGARGAGKSLWLDDADLQDHEQRGQDQRRGAGGGWDDNGRIGVYSRRPTRTEDDWDAEGGAHAEGKDLKTARRPPRREYIDEWGQVANQETVLGPSDRTEGRASTSYGHSSNLRGVGARKRSQKTEWDGEWGEYLDKVERRRPAGKQRQEEMDDPMSEEGYIRQGRDFADEPGAPIWDDANGGGVGGGGNQYGRRPAGQPGGRDRMRPGISKYNDRGRRGGEQRSASTRDASGDDGAASRSQGHYAEPERQAWGGENEWGRQDYRRGRGRPGEAEEGGPLVRGGIELSGEVLYGVAPVQAAIRAGRRELFTLYVQENLRPRKKGDKAAVERIKKEAQAAGALLREASKHTLNLLADNRPHQGLVLDAAPLGFTGLDELPPPPAEAAPLSAAAPLWVALDEVVDPQNFGAVLRSAYFLGAAGVLTCARNSSPLTAVVSKASAGAAEAMEVFSCGNMPTTLGLAVQDGWRVLGASADPDAPLITEVARGVPSVIVLGNEGVGLRTNVRRACSGFVRIAGQGTAFPLTSGSVQNGIDEVDVVQGEGDDESDGSDDEGVPEQLAERRGDVVVDSLNVSVAAGILLHELLAPRPMAILQEVGAGADDDGAKQPDAVLAHLLSSQTP